MSRWLPQAATFRLVWIRKVVDVDAIEELSGFVERVAALDIGKASVMACVRVPHPSRSDRRTQEVREYLTLTSALLELADWLRCERVNLVSMEATSTAAAECDDGWRVVITNATTA